MGLLTRKVNWVLDMDIRGFFDAIDHGGTRTRSEQGTPQGGSASPLLANIYLHYVFDLWVRRWRQTQARGEVIVVRYADDIVVGFRHRSDAELRRRLHDPVPEVGSWLRSVVGGHLRYYGVPTNSRALRLFRLRVGRLWYRSMRRRSQKTRLTWERMSRLLDHWLPPPRVCHPYPLYRLGVIPEAGARCGSPTLGAQGALAVSRRRGSGTVAVGGKGAGGPHAGSAMDRAGTTDSYGGGEGDGVRGVAYGAISRGG